MHGRDTMLGEVASASELFLLDTTPRPPVDARSGGPGGAPPAWGPASAGELRELPLNGRGVAGLVEAASLSGRTGTAETRMENANVRLGWRVVAARGVVAGWEHEQANGSGS